MKAVEEKILNLWTLGYSTSKIAAEIGRSKNSVCGLIFRMRERGISIPPKKSTREVVVLEKPAAPRVRSAPMTGRHLVSKKRKTFPELAKYTKGSAKDSLNIRFWKLKNNSCRYVVNDGRPETFIFCGAPKERGAYCAEHAAICFMPPKVPDKEYQRANARFK